MQRANYRLPAWMRYALALTLACLLLSLTRYAHGEVNGPALHLKTGLVDTSSPSAFPGADSSLYRIVQLQGPILPAWREALEANGATLLEYLPDYAYLVRVRGVSSARLQSLPGVRWVGPYRAEYKLAPELAKAEGQVEVMIQVFAGEDPQAVARAVEGWGGKARSASSGELAGYLQAMIPATALPRLVALPAVSWVEPYLSAELDNDVARRYDIMAVNPVWAGLGLYGAGQIVAVADTGMDTGNPDTLHADIRGRLLKAYGLGRPDDWSDPNGHGTHVAGSVLGNGAMSGSNPAAHDYADSFAGVAPEARLVMQSTLNADGGLSTPSNLNDLFGPPYQDGARIHTNSWSEYGLQDPDSVNGVYNTRSRQLDEFVWSHRDMTILFSASNAGKDKGGDGVVDTDSVRPPGTAKNNITVGATENYRPDRSDQYGQWWATDFPADPLKSDRMANDMGGMAAFSGRGPLDDGRVKPDIAAPGTFVVSVRSQVASGSGWGAYNDYYLYMGGTSMSTPLTAGAAAIVRQAYTQRLGVAAPSAALIKATLLNGARDIYPGQYGEGPCQEIGSPVPNWDTGGGRLNLRDSLMPQEPRMVRFVEERTGLQTGQSRTYTQQVVLVGDRQGTRPSTGQAELRLAPLTSDDLAAPTVPTDEVSAAINLASCTNRVSNGGFEQQLTGWTVEGRTELSTEDVHSGRYSAWLGGLDDAHDWLYQAILIPSDLSDGEISFWLYQDSDEPDCDCDYFWAGLYDPDWRTTYADISYRDGPAKTNGWQRIVHRLTPEEIEDIRGKRVYLAFEVKTDRSKVTSVWVDDVQFAVCTGGRLKPGPFRATLVWSDYPGAVEAAKSLVNDLDLEVVDPSGRHYLGNGGTEPDRLNPVEDVLIREPQVGRYQIIVRGYNVPMGPQPYALVISSDEAPIVRDKHAWVPLVRRR